MRAISRILVGLLAGLLLAGCRATNPDEEPRFPHLPEAIRKHISPYRLKDNRPYQLIWSERREFRKPEINFDDFHLWQVEASEGLEVSLARSEEQQLWGDYTGQITVSGAARPARVRLIPPAPIPLKDPFGSVASWFWIAQAVDPAQGPGALQLELVNDDGEERMMTFPMQGVAGWNLLHRKLPELMQPPWYLRAVIFHREGGFKGEDKQLYFDSIHLYKEPWKALSDQGWTGAGNAWPDIKDVPLSPLDPSSTAVSDTTTLERVQSLEGGRVAFQWQNHKRSVEYRIDPAAGLASLVVVGEDGEETALMHEAGWHPRVPRELTVKRLQGKACVLQYDNGDQLHFKLQGPGLIVEVENTQASYTHLSLGMPDSTHIQKSLVLPFYTWGADAQPQIQVLKSGRFLHVHVDPTVSRATRVDLASERDHGTLRYEVLSGKHRLTGRERIHITVSQNLVEVLPEVPTPLRDVNGAVQRPHQPALLRGQFGRRHTNEVLDCCSSLLHAGLGDVLLMGGTPCWSDAFDSACLRVRAAPFQGGDEGLKQFMAAYQSAGWKVGLYANVDEISPLHEAWKPDRIARDGDGSYRRARPGRFVLKRAQARDLGDKVLEKIQDRYRPDALLLDLAPVSPPWRSVDYDERSPGAGSLRSPYLSTLQALYERRKAEGALYAQDASPWLYGAWLDGISLDEQAPTWDTLYPFRPYFALYRLHPHVRLAGLGPYQRFADAFEGRTDSEVLSRYLSTLLAYGLVAELPGDAALSDQARVYYLMAQLEPRLRYKKMVRYDVFDGERIVPADRALSEGSPNRSQLYMHYEGDTEVWVNGHAEASWTVKAGRQAYTLPPFGWLVRGPDLLAYSAMAAGQRLDAVFSPDVVFLNPTGEELTYGNWRTGIPLALTKKAEQFRFQPLVEGLHHVYIPVAVMGETIDVTRLPVGVSADKNGQRLRVTCEGERILLPITAR